MVGNFAINHDSKLLHYLRKSHLLGVPQLFSALPSVVFRNLLDPKFGDLKFSVRSLARIESSVMFTCVVVVDLDSREVNRS